MYRQEKRIIIIVVVVVVVLVVNSRSPTNQGSSHSRPSSAGVSGVFIVAVSVAVAVAAVVQVCAGLLIRWQPVCPRDTAQVSLPGQWRRRQ